MGLRTGSPSIPTYLQGHGGLQSLSVDDTCSHEGFYYRYVCGACTCRWLIYEWCFYGGWILIDQESADGKHFVKRRYEEVKKHGWHEYYPRYYPANEPRAPIILAELWDHGRLIKRLENGVTVYDAEGKPDKAAARTRRAPKSAGRNAKRSAQAKTRRKKKDSSDA
jgi:hypothetical protein